MKYLLIFLFLLSSTVYGVDLKIIKNNPVKIKVDTTKPLSLNFNFNIKKVNILTNEEDDTQTVLVDKGLLIIFKKADISGQIIVTNQLGNSYIVYFENDGKESLFNFIDNIFEYNEKKTVKIKAKVTIVQNEIQRIVKKILLKQKLNGFSLINSPQTITAKDFVLERDKRYIGKKYIVDVWVGMNNSAEEIFIEEEEFYTKGIIAIAIEKNNIKSGEMFYLISILNKSSIIQLTKE